MVITGRFDMNVTPVTAWKIYKAIPGQFDLWCLKKERTPALV